MCAAIQGYSVHIGLNFVDPKHYQGWDGELVACEADANDMAAIASSMGYVTQSLIRQQATRAAVFDHVRAAAAKLQAGDIFLLSYSGHGGQVPDLTGEEADDAQDETWCLFDGQLIDDELELLWRGFADGVRIVVVSDSCHSGTVTKAMALSLDGNDQPRMVRVKTAPKSVLRRVYMANRAFYDRIQLATKVELTGRPSPLACTVRLLSGCMDGELSYDGEENGEFTAALLATWDFGRFRGNYASFHRAIVQRITTPQTPQHNVIGRHDPAFDAQRPFAIFDPTAHASRGTPATARTNSQRATRAIETYILDKRPEEIGMWRSRKPATDWGMNSPAWRGVANKIIGNFNTLDSAGAQIDPGDPGVGNAISNLHDEPLGSFHQYLTERADGVQISRRLVAIEADTREIA